MAQPGQPSRQVVRWLNLMADLQIKFSDDAEAPRLALQRIQERFPNSAVAENAAQRIARLGLEMKAKQKSSAIRLGSYETNLGLKMGKPPHRRG